MKFSSVIVLASSFLVTASALSPRQTVSKIESDITGITTQVNTLDSEINGFANPNGTLSQALTIHLTASGLSGILTNATSDVKSTPSPFSEADGTAILNAIANIVPTIVDALTGPGGIVAKKPAFAAIPLGNLLTLIKNDLISLNASTNGFESALISSAPADLKAQSTALKNTVDAAFATAIAAYS